MRKIITLATLICFLVPAAMGMAGPIKISVNQFVEHPALDAVLKGFRDYMKDNGVEVEYSVHNAQANMATATQIATQIMGEKPDMILAIATPSSQACAQAMKKSPHMQNTPLLFSAVTDPVVAGLVKNPKKPGGNITGVSDLIPVDKHMENLKIFIPNLKKLGIIYNSGEANSKKIVELINEQGKKMGFEVVDATVSKTSEVYQAAKSLAGKVDAVFVPTDNTVVAAFESAVKTCEQNKLPLFAADVSSVERGAVAAMGFDYYKHGRQTGAMAKRILDGAKPGGTPVETQQELQLQINLKAAKAMGVTVPEDRKKIAEKVYE